MTPKEKAAELVEAFQTVVWEEHEEIGYINVTGAIQCAIICVEEILKNTPKTIHGYTEALNGQIMIVDNPGIYFWKSVLMELKSM